MIYSKTTTQDEIIVKTYHKECLGIPPFTYCCGNIIVNNIDDLMIGGTVNVTIGDDIARDMKKSELINLINPYSDG